MNKSLSVQCIGYLKKSVPRLKWGLFFKGGKYLTYMGGKVSQNQYIPWDKKGVYF